MSRTMDVSYDKNDDSLFPICTLKQRTYLIVSKFVVENLQFLSNVVKLAPGLLKSIELEI